MAPLLPAGFRRSVARYAARPDTREMAQATSPPPPRPDGQASESGLPVDRRARVSRHHLSFDVAARSRAVASAATIGLVSSGRTATAPGRSPPAGSTWSDPTGFRLRCRRRRLARPRTSEAARGGDASPRRRAWRPVPSPPRGRLRLATPRRPGPSRSAWVDGAWLRLWMSDLHPGRYLEMWMPANLVHDRFTLNVDGQVESAGVPSRDGQHGPGWTSPTGGSPLVADYPDHFTALSPMLVIAPGDRARHPPGARSPSPDETLARVC